LVKTPDSGDNCLCVLLQLLLFEGHTAD